MFAILAHYHGKQRRRAEYVRNAAQALGRMPNVPEFEILDVDKIFCVFTRADACVDVCMALLAAGDWRLCLTIGSHETNPDFALSQLRQARSHGTIRVAATHDPHRWVPDIMASFQLLGFVLQKRTLEGREATSLVRSGLNQNEAAEHLGISKQAMSQRLQAAGWRAELAGYRQAISLLERAAADLD